MLLHTRYPNMSSIPQKTRSKRTPMYQISTKTEPYAHLSKGYPNMSISPFSSWKRKNQVLEKLKIVNTLLELLFSHACLKYCMQLARMGNLLNSKKITCSPLEKLISGSNPQTHTLNSGIRIWMNNNLEKCTKNCWCRISQDGLCKSPSQSQMYSWTCWKSTFEFAWANPVLTSLFFISHTREFIHLCCFKCSVILTCMTHLLHVYYNPLLLTISCVIG